jgi:hypothetical protein
VTTTFEKALDFLYEIDRIVVCGKEMWQISIPEEGMLVGSNSYCNEAKWEQSPHYKFFYTLEPVVEGSIKNAKHYMLQDMVDWWNGGKFPNFVAIDREVDCFVLSPHSLQKHIRRMGWDHLDMLRAKRVDKVR